MATRSRSVDSINKESELCLISLAPLMARVTQEKENGTHPTERPGFNVPIKLPRRRWPSHRPLERSLRRRSGPVSLTLRSRRLRRRRDGHQPLSRTSRIVAFASSVLSLKFVPHDVSSRLERSGVEGSAVSTICIRSQSQVFMPRTL